MSFCTAINCMDGRVQLPVIQYLQKRFDVPYVDSVTEPGPILILAQQNNAAAVQAILERVGVSVNKHRSVGIAVVGHHDCTGNPVPYDKQIGQIGDSTRFLRNHYSDTTVIGLWVDSDWKVHEVRDDETKSG